MEVTGCIKIHLSCKNLQNVSISRGNLLKNDRFPRLIGMFCDFYPNMDEFSSPFRITILAFQQGKIDSPKILDYML